MMGISVWGKLGLPALIFKSEYIGGGSQGTEFLHRLLLKRTKAEQSKVKI
jgi:hypothetical protein